MPSMIRGAPLELHPIDDQQPFSRDDDPNLPSSLDFGRELESPELGLKTVLSVAVKSSLSGHKKLLCGENVFEYHTLCLHFDGFV